MSDASDSEGEDAVNARVDLAQDYNRVAHANTRSRVILQEVGPRMELELMKVEEGMCEGRVLYHAYVQKTEEEVLELEQKKVDKEALRKKRREEQEANVRRKAKEAAEKAAIEEEMAGLGRKKRKRAKSKDDAKKSFGMNEAGGGAKKGRRGDDRRRDGDDFDGAVPPFKRGRKGSIDRGAGGAKSGGAQKSKKNKTAADKKNKRPSKQARAAKQTKRR